MEERVERVERDEGDDSNDGYLPITLVKYGVSRGKFDRQCSDGSERYFVISDILLLRHLAKYSVGAESREAATKKYGVWGTGYLSRRFWCSLYTQIRSVAGEEGGEVLILSNTEDQPQSLPTDYLRCEI